MSVESAFSFQPLRWIILVISFVFFQGAALAQVTPVQDGPTGTTNVNPTIRWTGEGQWFHIWLASGTSASPGAPVIEDQYGAGVWLETPASNELLIDGDVLINGTALLPGNYVWWVRSWAGGVSSAWSSGMNFTVVAVDELAQTLAPLLSQPPTTVFPLAGMKWIKPGTFIMGSPPNEVLRQSDETQHAVTLTKGFWIGSHEVTQAEYAAVIGNNPSAFTGDTNRPVEKVSWNDAVVYCTTLTVTERNAGRIPAGWEYRLPTEAEWEYCCRAGAGTTRFGYGDDVGATALDDYAWHRSNSGSSTNPVEQKRGNAWGLHDMHGNVWEWCQDWYGAYPTGSATDPQGAASGSFRVIRGGSWFRRESLTSCANREADLPGTADDDYGFRAVLAPVLTTDRKTIVN